MNPPDLDALLEDLRLVGDETQHVEVKRARGGLPTDLGETVSAFQNSEGGTIVLGITETGEPGHRGYVVSGVAEPGVLAERVVRLLGDSLHPPVRTEVHVVQHPDGDVIWVDIPPLLSRERPSHLGASAHGGAYRRVGSADQLLSETEVTELLARRGVEHDDTSDPVDQPITLDDARVAQLVRTERQASSRLAGQDDEQVAVSLGVLSSAARDRPTLAAALLLGRDPARFEPAARLALRVGAPGERGAATHLEGDLGQLLDDAVTRAQRELVTAQVGVAGRVLDHHDVSLDALREVVSNALFHRSFAPWHRQTPVTVHVMPTAVVVDSPGGLAHGVEASELGLEQRSVTGRNHTMIRLGERLRAPSGARLIEHVAAGIPDADRNCVEEDVLAPIFIAEPTRVRAVLPRGRLGATERDDVERLALAAGRLATISDRLSAQFRMPSSIDLPYARRLLGGRPPDEAAVALLEAVRRGSLVRSGPARARRWTPGTDAPLDVADMQRGVMAARTHVRTTRREALVAAIRAAGTDGLAMSAMLELDVGSRPTIARELDILMELGVVEPTTLVRTDPTRRYRLRGSG